MTLAAEANRNFMPFAGGFETFESYRDYVCDTLIGLGRLADPVNFKVFYDPKKDINSIRYFMASSDSYFKGEPVHGTVQCIHFDMDTKHVGVSEQTGVITGNSGTNAVKVPSVEPAVTHVAGFSMDDGGRALLSFLSTVIESYRHKFGHRPPTAPGASNDN